MLKANRRNVVVDMSIGVHAAQFVYVARMHVLLHDEVCCAHQHPMVVSVRLSLLTNHLGADSGMMFAVKDTSAMVMLALISAVAARG